MWVLVDAEGIVRNLIRWDGVTEYDPAPFTLRPYHPALEFDQPYVEQ